MTTVLLDSHVLLWLDSDPERISRSARDAIRFADTLTVASVTWYELAWLAHHDRIQAKIPLSAWLENLSAQVLTAHLTPDIAATAVQFPDSFPGDPTDRVIYATAIENGWQLVTKDEKLHAYRHSTRVTIW